MVAVKWAERSPALAPVVQAVSVAESITPARESIAPGPLAPIAGAAAKASATRAEIRIVARLRMTTIEHAVGA